MRFIRLLKDWGGRSAGDVLEVDAERAEKLIADGWAEGELWTPDNLSVDGLAKLRASGATFRKGRGFDEGKKKG